MSETGKAVFLSYASQDAEAARRIAEALRAAGVEVWFDQSELRGGDAWDAKIRRQIKECALFVPVITPSTNARAEGYFRLEWKLAVDRSHLMADDAPFLFPIVVGDVSDATARVPDKFREVQWTRVRLDESPAELAARVVRLLAGDVASAGAASRRDEKSSAAKKSGLERWWWLIFPIMGMSVPIIGMLKRPSRPRPEPPVVSTAAAKPTAEPAKETAVPSALDPQRVALARFENLTGDASLDHLARVIEAELTRGLGGVAGLRLVPLEIDGRAAGRTAARAAGAASVIVGTYAKRGGQIELSTEIVLVDAGEIFGSLGSAPLSAADPRGPALEEFVDRLAMGAESGVAVLRDPPTRLAAVIPDRPWDRRSLYARVWNIRVQDGTAASYAAAIIQLRELLREAPDLMQAKHNLARVLVAAGRFEEAQQVYRELLGPDLGRLSEFEIYAINYDEAFLLGNPERALNAALSSLELLPKGDGTRKVVSCLWALSRPREAQQRIEAWFKTHSSGLSGRERQWVEQGVIWVEIARWHWEGAAAEALDALERLRKVTDGQPQFGYHVFKLAALSSLGREAEQMALVNEAAIQLAATRAEPFYLQWLAHGMALHRGRPEEARRWLDAAIKSWDALPPAARNQDAFQARAAVLLVDSGRHEEAWAAAKQVEGRAPDLPGVVGLMALVSQATGRNEEAAAYRKRLERMDARFTRGQPEFWRARLAARSGDKARAVELLQQAVTRGLWFGNYNSLLIESGRNEPEFAMLRGYGPYEELLRPKG